VNPRWIAACCLGIVSLLVLSIASGIATTGENQEKPLPSQTPFQLEKARETALIKNPGSFIEATTGEPTSLDPAIDYEQAGGNILQNVYETLLWYDGASTNLTPMLATVIPSVANGGISPSGQSFNFTLRTGVKFHDNSTLTADDVVFSIQRVLKIHEPTGPGWMIQQILDDNIAYFIGDTVANYLAQSYYAPWIVLYLTGQPGGLNHVITQNDVAGVANLAITKINSTVVNFRLTHPYPGFLATIAYTVTDILSKNYVIAHPDLNSSCMGTGPYKLVSWDLGVQIHLRSWSNYWGTKASIQDVYVMIVSDETTRILMLQAGDADTAYIPINLESQFTNNSNYTIWKGTPTFTLSIAGFNENINTSAAALFGSNVPSNFFQDKHTRSAFAHLLNCTQLINNVLHGNAIVPNGPIPKGMFGYASNVPAYNYSLALAKQELQLAQSTTPGQSWWQKGFTVAFIYNSGNLMRETICSYLKAALESLGPQFHATTTALDSPTYSADSRMRPSPLPLFYYGWMPDYADPDDYCNPFLATGGYYPWITGYSNATIDALVWQASSELDVTLRAALYNQITWMAHNDTPYIWLYQPSNFHIERSWISGYYFNPMYSDLYYAALSKAPPMLTFNLTLVKGWNFVSVPLVGYGYKASTIGLVTGDMVSSWSSATQKYNHTYIKGISPPSSDFALTSHAGYWIWVAAAKTLHLNGTVPTTMQTCTFTVPMKGGWLAFGFESLKTTLKANNLTTMYSGTGAVTMVAYFNAATGKYSSWVSAVPNLNNFLIVPGHAYWIWITVGTGGTISYMP